MTIINNKYDEKEVKNAIEKALSDFYNALLANLNKLQIRDIIHTSIAQNLCKGLMRL